MHRTAYIFLFLTTLFWGGNAVAGRFAAGHVSPMLLTTLRWTFAVAILMAFALPRLKQDWPAIRPRLLYMVLLGAIGFAAYNIAFYTALNYTTAVNVSIEQAGMPMIIIIGNFILFRIRAAPGQIVGFMLSIVGVALTASHGDLSRLAALNVNLGDALTLLALLFYAGYTIALRFKPQIHWMSMMLVLSLAALVTSIPFAVWEFARGRTVMPDATGWAVAAYISVFPSLLAQVFFMRGVELIGGNRAGLFVNLMPIFGTLLSVLILGEAFHLYHAVAMALVLCGIALAEYSGRKLAA